MRPENVRAAGDGERIGALGQADDRHLGQAGLHGGENAAAAVDDEVTQHEDGLQDTMLAHIGNQVLERRPVEDDEAFPLFARSTGIQRLSHDPMGASTQTCTEMTTCNDKRLAVPLAVQN